MNHTAEKTHSGQAELGHVVPVSTLLGTCIALMILTWITVGATRFQLGYFNIWIALIIATVKAVLVCLYFMHLRWDRPFNAIVLITAVCFMLLFLGGALTDTGAYNNEVEWKQSDFLIRQNASSPAPAPAESPAGAANSSHSEAAGSATSAPASAPTGAAPH